MHNQILNKKRDRLAKYTGRKLVLKQRAYQKALDRFKQDCPPTVRTITVDSADPEWVVSAPGRDSFKVLARNEKKARAEARDVLRLRALPAGTVVEKT